MKWSNLFRRMSPLGILVILAVLGCSAITHSSQYLFEDPVVYSTVSMRLETGDSADIVAFCSSAESDLIVAIETRNAESDPDWLDAPKRRLIGLLADLSLSSGQTMKYLIDLSGSQLNALALEHGLEITVDDIVAFSDLKTWIDSAPERIYLSRQTLFEAALGRTLDASEVDGLSDFQDYVTSRNRSGEPVSVENLTEAELRAELETLGYDETKSASVMIGFFLVKDLADEAKE